MSKVPYKTKNLSFPALSFALILSLAFAIIGLTSSSMAQSNAGGNSGGVDPGGPPIGGGTAPIGGGILLLVLMAAGYAIKIHFDAKNKLEDPDL